MCVHRNVVIMLGVASSLRALHHQHNNKRVWMNIGGVKRKLVKKTGGHATKVVQLKIYKPLRPSISGSVNEKFCHIENE